MQPFPLRCLLIPAVFFGCKTIVLACNGWGFLYFLMEVLWTSMLVYLYYCNSGEVQNFPIDFGNSQCFVAGPFFSAFSFLPPFDLFVRTAALLQFETCPVLPGVLVQFPSQRPISTRKQRLCRYQWPEKFCFVFLISPLTLWFFFFCMLSAVGRIAKIIIWFYNISINNIILIYSLYNLV